LPALGTNISNIKYTGLADGSNNSMFSGGILAKITDSNGVEIGEQIYRPLLYTISGMIVATLKTGSFASLNKGTRTRFADNGNVNPVVAYWNGSSYVNITGTGAAGQEVLVDQVGTARPNPPNRGAIDGYVDNLYLVKVLASANGTVSGGTIFGDVYPAGTPITLIAIPNSGYAFTRWDYVLGDYRLYNYLRRQRQYRRRCAYGRNLLVVNNHFGRRHNGKKRVQFFIVEYEFKRSRNNILGGRFIFRGNESHALCAVDTGSNFYRRKFV
jgi:hypothetical protein